MPPTRTCSMQALESANEVRACRRDLRIGLRDGTVRFEDVLREPAWFLSSVLVYELLMWMPRLAHGPGRHRGRGSHRLRVSLILRRADVWPLREVGKLTRNQRARLLAETRR